MTRLMTAAAVVALVACGGAPPVVDAFASPEQLVQALLNALANRQEYRLRQLAVSEPEFRAYVWPALPASRPERNLPLAYVWGDLTQKSNASLNRTLAAHAGRRYTLRGMTTSATKQYPGFRVHRAAVVQVRDAAGVPLDLRLCGSLFERQGSWKVFSYVIDD